MFGMWWCFRYSSAVLFFWFWCSPIVGVIVLVIPGGSRFVVLSWLYLSLVSDGVILCLQNVFDYVILRGGGMCVLNCLNEFNELDFDVNSFACSDVELLLRELCLLRMMWTICDAGVVAVVYSRVGMCSDAVWS